MKKILFLLGELNNDDLDWIAANARTEIIPPSQTLVDEGSIINALYVVLSGKLSVSIHSLDKELATISSGEVVGEISFIDNRPPLATVKAIEKSLILEISRLNLTAKLQKDLGFASRFYHAISLFLSDRMRGTVVRLGYGIDLEREEIEEEELNPSVRDKLELAEVKFKWLIDSVLRKSGQRL